MLARNGSAYRNSSIDRCRPPHPQELSIHAFTLYQLRFIFAADLCQAWSKFGGIGTMLAQLSTVSHIGVTENVGSALAYRMIVSTILKEKERKRTVSPSEFAVALSVESFTPSEQDKKEIQLDIESDNKAKDRDHPNGKGEGKKGGIADRRSRGNTSIRGEHSDHPPSRQDSHRNNDRRREHTTDELNPRVSAPGLVTVEIEGRRITARITAIDVTDNGGVTCRFVQLSPFLPVPAHPFFDKLKNITSSLGVKSETPTYRLSGALRLSDF